MEPGGDAEPGRCPGGLGDSQPLPCSQFLRSDCGVRLQPGQFPGHPLFLLHGPVSQTCRQTRTQRALRAGSGSVKARAPGRCGNRPAAAPFADARPGLSQPHYLLDPPLPSLPTRPLPRLFPFHLRRGAGTKHWPLGPTWALLRAGAPLQGAVGLGEGQRRPRDPGRLVRRATRP